MKNNRVLASFLIILLTSCSSNAKPIESKIFCFDTYVGITLYDGEKNNIIDIEGIIKKYDELADNYRARDVNNVSSAIGISELIVLIYDAFDINYVILFTIV